MRCYDGAAPDWHLPARRSARLHLTTLTEGRATGQRVLNPLVGDVAEEATDRRGRQRSVRRQRSMYRDQKG